MIRRLFFVSGCALILAGLAVFYVSHFFTWDDYAFPFLSTNSAAWSWLVGMREMTPWFTPWFWPSATLLAAGTILAAWTRKRAAVELGSPLGASAMTGFSSVDFLRPGIAIPTLAALVSVGLIGAAVGRGEAFPLWPWLLGLGAVAAVGWAKDHANGSSERRRLFTVRELGLTAATLAHLVGLGLLHREPEWRVWTTALDLSAIAVLCWRRPGLTTFWLLQGLLAVSMFYYVVEIESWRYGGIGDEADFYDLSGLLAAGADQRPYLNGEGVYGHHPLSASYHQAWGRTLFGDHVYGWRMSGVICAHLAGLALFGVLREMINARYALMGCATLLAAHRMLAMVMTGYNQMQGLAVMVIFWAVLLLAIKRGSYLGYALAGMLAVAGLFTFTLVVPLALIGAALMLVAGFPRRTDDAGQGGYTFAPICVFMAGLALAALPRVLDMSWVGGQLELTGLSGTDAAPVNAWQRAGLNVLYTVLSFGQNREDSHYTSGPLLDALTSLFFIIGLVWLIAGGWRLRYGRWLVLSCVAVLGVVGGLCVHPYPPNTRLFVLAPVCVLIATVGLVQAGAFVASRVPGGRRMRWIAGACYACGVFAMNGWQLHGVLDRTYERSSAHYVLKTLADEGGRRPVFIVDKSREGPDPNLAKALAIYGYSKNDYTEVANVGPATRLGEIALRAPSAVVCLQANSVNEADWRRAAAGGLVRWKETVFKDGRGVPHLIVFERGRDE